MLRIVFAFLALFASFGSFASEAAQPLEGPRPIAVLLTTDPWLMVVGSDTPRFALYDDGQVIFVEQTSEGRYTHMAARLSPSELAGVKAKLLAFTAHPVPKRINLRPGWTDQPESRFFLDVDGHKLVTSVYGLASVKDTSVSPRGEQDGADALPAAIKGLHQYLSEFHVASAKQWIPNQLEVMLWDYSYAPGASIKWRTDWPGLSHPTTRKRGDAYSIFLPGTQEQALVAFLATRNEKGAVEVARKKWAVSYRRVFPRWRDAFREE